MRSPRPGVLFLIHDLRLGGAERVFLSYVQNVEAVEAIPVLVRRRVEILDGVDPRAVLDLETAHPGRARDDPGLPGPMGDGGRRRFASGWWAPAPLALLLKALRLRRLVRRSGARTVSTFLHKSHAIALCTKLLLDRSLRVVVNVHELPSQHLEHHFGPLGRILMRAFMRACFPRADLIVVVAQGVKDDLVEGFGVPASRVEVVSNPLDLDGIRRRADAPVPESLGGDDRPLVVAVGRLVPLKGLDYLLRAWARLSRRVEARLAVLGEGPERGRLEELARSLELEDSVRFLGALDNPWVHISRARVLVLSSLTEGFPNVIGEAMALGTPVVATHCSPGVEEYLEGGRCGLLVPPADPPALAAALERLLLDPELGRRLARRGMERVQAFDLPRVVRTYEGLLLGTERADD